MFCVSFYANCHFNGHFRHFDRPYWIGEVNGIVNLQSYTISNAEEHNLSISRRLQKKGRLESGAKEIKK